MTEVEWLACEDPEEMFDWLDRSRRTPDRSPRLVRRLRQEVLDTLRTRATPQTLRLFTCACCRRLWHLIPSWLRAAGEAAEEYAADPDGEVRLALDDRAIVLRETLRTCLPLGRSRSGVEDATNYLTLALLRQLHHSHQFVPRDAVRPLVEAAAWAVVRSAPDEMRRAAMQAEQTAQCELLRDVLGNPFRPVPLNTAWRTDTVLTVAAQMYEARDFSALPVLADALQDARCDSAEVLDHCRGPGPHVRGCWVVDLVLGRG